MSILPEACARKRSDAFALPLRHRTNDCTTSYWLTARNSSGGPKKWRQWKKPPRRRPANSATRNELRPLRTGRCSDARGNSCRSRLFRLHVRIATRTSRRRDHRHGHGFALVRRCHHALVTGDRRPNHTARTPTQGFLSGIAGLGLRGHGGVQLLDERTLRACGAGEADRGKRQKNKLKILSHSGPFAWSSLFCQRRFPI